MGLLHREFVLFFVTIIGCQATTKYRDFARITYSPLATFGTLKRPSSSVIARSKTTDWLSNSSMSTFGIGTPVGSVTVPHACLTLNFLFETHVVAPPYKPATTRKVNARSGQVIVYFMVSTLRGKADAVDS